MIAPADTASEQPRISKGEEAENTRRIEEASAVRREKTEQFRPSWKDAFYADRRGF